MLGAAYLALILGLLAMLLLAPIAGAATRRLELGFSDPGFGVSDPQARGAGLDAARSLGAGIVRIEIRWAAVASKRPRDGADPNDPAYRWSEVDARVREASSRGFRVLPMFLTAPRWAEGPGRPSSAAAGTWLPDARAFGQFAQAAARRYRQIHQWQIWNEPNLAYYLSPQWRRQKGRLIAVAPGHYRRMLNSAYAGLKRVNRDNRVVTAGTAPYGDPPGDVRMFPATFWRRLLRRATHFDAYDHHPYAVGGPRRHAVNPGDASIPDLGRLTSIVRSATRRGHVLPRARKPLWITEFGWDSRPPDPRGVPSRRLARWVADALYLLWKQGAHVVMWSQIRDAPPTDGYARTYQGGLLRLSGVSKIAARAYAFPIACQRMPHRRLRVWGRAPKSGRLRIVRDRRTIRRLRVRRGDVFLRTVRGTTGVQARMPGRISLPCKSARRRPVSRRSP